MELSSAMIERRSVRKYSDTKVSDEIITEILEHAVWAPSGTNLQPWYFVAVKSEEARNKVLDIMSGAAERFKPYLEKRFEKFEDVKKRTFSFVQSLGNAPVFILVFLLKDYEQEMRFACEQSVAAAIQNVLLKSYDLGLKTCWLTASKLSEQSFRDQFGEGKGEFMGLITLGYGEQPAYAPPRKDERYIIV